MHMFFYIIYSVYLITNYYYLKSTLNKKYEIQDKNNIIVEQSSMKEIDSCTSLNVPQKHYKNTLPNTQIKLQQFNINVMKNKQSRDKGSEAYNKRAVYLYENQSSKFVVILLK